MNRADILATASEYVTRDRAATHGDAENSFAEIGAHWALELGVPVSAAQVARMMVLLKLVRAKRNPAHADNAIDAAGYAAIMGEIGASA